MSTLRSGTCAGKLDIRQVVPGCRCPRPTTDCPRCLPQLRDEPANRAERRAKARRRKTT